MLGEIVPIEVQGADGSRKRSLARPDILQAAPPDPPNHLRILSPFDPALRDRDRAQFLFGFHYRIEVFVPKPQRKYGYYVFPVLEGARLIVRIDAKAFHDAGTLRVRAFWPEAGITLTTLRRQKRQVELERLAKFASCDRLDFTPNWLRNPIP